MKRDIPTIGSTYNRWTVLQDLGICKEGKYGYHYVLAYCECGTIKKVMLTSLKGGHSKSCGCLNAEKVRTTRLIHGQSQTRLYSIWKDMRRRCQNGNKQRHVNYGKRGIRVCDEWEDFQVFHKWAIENSYDDTLSIDRIDNMGNYDPTNCRWATRTVQNNNTRKQKDFLAISPERQIYHYRSQAECGRMHGLSRKGIGACLRGEQYTHHGWSFQYC